MARASETHTGKTAPAAGTRGTFGPRRWNRRGRRRRYAWACGNSGAEKGRGGTHTWTLVRSRLDKPHDHDASPLPPRRARLRRRAPRPHRPLPRRALRRARPAAVRAAAGGEEGRARPQVRARPRLARKEEAPRGGHDLSHLLDDQADHEHRPHDARRGRADLARRPGRPLDPVVARADGVSRRAAGRLRRRGRSMRRCA